MPPESSTGENNERILSDATKSTPPRVCAAAQRHRRGVLSVESRRGAEGDVQISTGGPYVAKVGVPITLHGTYFIEGQNYNSDHLKVIGQALRSYAQVHGTYPPAAFLNAKGKETVSWRVLILPYLGQKALYDRFDLTKPWNSPTNLCILSEMPQVYRKSSDAVSTTETGFAGVQGSGSLFQNACSQLNGGRKISGITGSEAVAAGAVGANVHLPWSAPGDIDISKVTQLGSPDSFAGEGAGFTPFVFLDGTVHLIPNKTRAASMTIWSQVGQMMPNNCRCAPPSSVDAGLKAVWELGDGATINTQGWNVTFQACKSGKQTVTLHAYDHFGNEYSSSTTVEVE